MSEGGIINVQCVGKNVVLTLLLFRMSHYTKILLEGLRKATKIAVRTACFEVTL
jgi:hypothetical protein